MKALSLFIVFVIVVKALLGLESYRQQRWLREFRGI